LTDASGEEIFRLAYDSYGSLDISNSGKLNYTTMELERTSDQAGFAALAVRFTGQEYDPETGFYYYNARYYSSELGIFTTADTIVPDPTDSQSYNRYMYVRGNPINKVDPTGHEDIFYLSFGSGGGVNFGYEHNGTRHNGTIPGFFPAAGGENKSIGTVIATSDGSHVYRESGNYGNTGYGKDGIGSGGPLGGSALVATIFFSRDYQEALYRPTSEAAALPAFSWDNLPREDKIVLGVVAGVTLAAAAIFAAPVIASTAAAYGPASMSTFFATGGASLLGAGAVIGPHIAGQIQAEAAAAENIGASLATNGARLNRYLYQLEKYGEEGVRQLENGRFRFYGSLRPSTNLGETIGQRTVREWNPATGGARTWMESLDAAGRVRVVRPEMGLPKVHFRFDQFGNFVEKW